MQYDNTNTPSRRERRARRRGRRLASLVVAGGALGVLTAVGLVVTTPGAASALEPALSPATALSSAAESMVAEPVAEITSEARTAVAAARVAVAQAETVRADIVASELDLGAEPTSIDTDALDAAADRLAGLDVLPLLLDRAAPADVAARAETVTADALDLRERLNEGLAQRALQKAADRAAAAEAAAAAAAAAEAQRQAEAAAALAAANTPDGAKATARQMAASQYGWGDGQFSCLESLWTKESSWDYQAYNDSSGATGIPQALPGNKMASAGGDWQTNATTQISWGLGYIASVYGTPCAAWGHSQATDWY